MTKPSPIIIRTALDEHGSLLDLPRIPGESLVDYSKRLFDTYANRASSTYSGLLNGINRELGLEKTDVLKINIKGLGYGFLDNPNITVSTTTITNNTSYTNLINGGSVTAVGTLLTDTTQDWEPQHLRGLTLKINGVDYPIKANTSNTVTVLGDMSGLVGFNYLIEADWEDNSLIGLGLEIGNSLFKISENTANIIQVEAGDLTKVDSNLYKIRAYNPKIEVTGAKILMYKEFNNNDNFQLEKEIDIRLDARFHKDIVQIINGLTFFEAEDTEDRDIFAFTLSKQSSEHIVIKETIPAAKFFKLKNKDIKDGSVRFTESNIFLREVPEDDVSQLLGNYHIDYSQGIVKVNSLPSGNKTVSYSWNDFPFTITASPTIINALNKEDSEQFLFVQQEMRTYTNQKDRFRSTVPKADMIEYIHELLSIKPSSWGE